MSTAIVGQPKDREGRYQRAVLKRSVVVLADTLACHAFTQLLLRLYRLASLKAVFCIGFSIGKLHLIVEFQKDFC